MIVSVTGVLRLVREIGWSVGKRIEELHTLEFILETIRRPRDVLILGWLLQAPYRPYVIFGAGFGVAWLLTRIHRPNRSLGSGIAGAANGILTSNRREGPVRPSPPEVANQEPDRNSELRSCTLNGAESANARVIIRRRRATYERVTWLLEEEEEYDDTRYG